MNKIIGLVGEDPNDTTAVKNLLLQRFNKNITYLPLINRAKGYQLDNARVKHALCIECRIKKPDIVIFIRDADGVATETNAISKCKDWFHRMSADLKSQNIFLLNIYELKALIFADIEIFNKHYYTQIKGNRDVTYIREPKEELINRTSKLKKTYRESDCPSYLNYCV